MEKDASWRFSRGDVEWKAVVEAYGQPIESSIVTDSEWNAAKRDGKVVSIVFDESGVAYTGFPGLLLESVMCRVVFPCPIPQGIVLTSVALDDINWDFSKAAQDASRATELLISASRTGNLEQLQFAIESGADVNHIDETSEPSSSPIQLATSCGHIGCVEALFAANAEVSSDIWRLAILNGHSNIADLLEHRGVLPAAEHALIQAAHDGNVTALLLLITRRADLNKSSSLRSPYQIEGTPLTVAILSGHRDAVDLLLTKGADRHAVDHRGITPWIAAASTGQSDLCSVFAIKSEAADVQIAFVLAAKLGNATAIRALSKLGADASKQAMICRENMSPLFAVFESHEIGRYASHANDTEDSDAIEALRYEVMDALLSLGADPNVRNGKNCPLLLRAAKCGKSNVITLLIEHGADVDITDLDGTTALISAVEWGRDECVRPLLLAGADPNIGNEKGQVAMMKFFDYDSSTRFVPPNPQVAKWLIAFGADPQATNKAGKTIRSYAKRALRKAKVSSDDDFAENCQSILEILNNEDSLTSYAGVMAMKPTTVDEAFRRANCAFAWLQDAEVTVHELAQAVQLNSGALGRVIAGLAADDWEMRYVAALACAKIAAASEDAIPHLIRRLDDDDSDVRIAAAQALERIGECGVSQLMESIISSASPLAACLASLVIVRIDSRHLAPVTETLAARLPADEDSLEGKPAFEAAKIHGVLGDLHLSCVNYAAAVAEYQSAIRLNPSLQVGRWSDFAQVNAALGDASFANAISHYSEGQELSFTGDYVAAKEAYQRAIDASSEFPWGYNNLAWQMATCVDPDHRDGGTAVTLAERASELTGNRYHGILDTLAAAYAEVGNFTRAAAIQEATVRVAPDHALEEYQYNLKRYRSGQAWCEYNSTTSDDDSDDLSKSHSADMTDDE